MSVSGERGWSCSHVYLPLTTTLESFGVRGKGRLEGHEPCRWSVHYDVDPVERHCIRVALDLGVMRSP